jgi:hypothetical protein
MSEDQNVDTFSVSSNGSSLAARAQARRAQLSAKRTVTLPVPGYQDMLSVEYRVLTYAETKRIVARNERIREEAVQDLTNYADQLIAASVTAYELPSKRELGAGWTLSLCKEMGVEIGEGMTTRQALFSVLDDILLFKHYMEYMEWMQGAEADIDSEQSEAFPATSS